ncbi:MAG TPA: hypothetical protein VED47_00050 [Burkholderiaceae bacterium]|nr:hypothetical protein [Burkholderiaceae bacterium]
MSEEKANGGGIAGSVALGEIERVIAGARDALTDDTVTRLAATVGASMDLLDRANRSGVGDALPTIAAMVRNGDLQRVADFARLAGAAEDSLSDDIVARVTAAASGGMDLLDRVNRSGILRALPTITRMAESGDLERLAGLARLVAAMEDSLSDDIVNRVSTVATELAALVDKLARNPGFLRLIEVLGRDEVQCGLIDLAESACAAKAELAKQPAPSGGVFALLRIASDPGTQSALRFVSLVSAQMRKTQSGSG